MIFKRNQVEKTITKKQPVSEKDVTNIFASNCLHNIFEKIKNKLVKCQSCTHTETSQLIYKANQLTGFYMKITLAFNGLMSKH